MLISIAQVPPQIRSPYAIGIAMLLHTDVPVFADEESYQFATMEGQEVRNTSRLPGVYLFTAHQWRHIEITFDL